MNKWVCSKCVNCNHRALHDAFGCAECECNDYQLCGIEHIGSAPCECSVVKIEKTTTDQKIPKGTPEYGKPKQPVKHELAKGSVNGMSEAHKAKMGAALNAHKTTDELLSDPEFDTSLAASRARLELSLALASELALRKAKAGCVSDGAAEFIQSVTNTYRILANTATAKPAEEMSDAELAAAAGKK